MGFLIGQLKEQIAGSIFHRLTSWVKRRESAWGVPNVSGARKSSSIATFGERT